MVLRPTQFDVIVTPNLYGAILQNIGSGLVGGPGIVPGANIGTNNAAVFESVLLFLLFIFSIRIHV